MLKVSLLHSCLSALIGTQAARALVLLEKEGVHLIHGQSATGYGTVLHLGEVGLVAPSVRTSALLVLARHCTRFVVNSLIL